MPDMPRQDSQAGQVSEAKPSEQKSFAAPPTISLPKGGGAIRGIGEKFSANPTTGTGSMTIPIAVSPGRSGFGPQLSLSYDSGSGNGPFGFGWSLALPSITRKTDKGLPQYLDAAESDVFILSGAEDLVPVFRRDANGAWLLDAQGRHVLDETERSGYMVRRYRPRIEGLFARIERWTNIGDPADVHWRSLSKDNVLTVYGRDANSRVADPAGGRRIFTWLICETRDDKGNAALYEYKPEDGAGVELARAHERNRGDRNDPRRTANRYLKHVYYGNRTPLLDAASGRRPRFLSSAQVQNAGWMFEVVFDYGEHDVAAPQKEEAGQWACRHDPFSSYRAGFEVRTYRRCQRVLMFHHFEGEPGTGKDCLVRSTDFTYSTEQDSIYSFLLSVAQTGYQRNNSGYLKRSMPALHFAYSQPVVQDTVQTVDARSLENLPIGLDGTAYQWTDLHGEGIPGILAAQAGAWFYRRNISPLSSPSGAAQFAPVETVATTPNLNLAGGQAQFMDLAGDGQPDLVVLDGPMPGLYEHDDDEGWLPFRPFSARLNHTSRDPNLKLVDMDGDGHADVLITEDEAFVWHPSLAEEGFGPARRFQQALDEEKGPRLVFADEGQSIYLADMSGDGLTDLARIRNGEVCYWPNLGYGCFGAKVTMDGAPFFDAPEQFDQKRVRLADIDGSGTSDIIYLHGDGVRLYFNQSGNGWSAAQPLKAFPGVDSLTAVMPTDLLGNGTTCLVWSSPLPGDAGLQMRYVDLMGGQKPHLLLKTSNNLGAETEVKYASSTKFYLQDRRDGRQWITRLPFPVHVVERVETRDRVSGNRFVSRYAYHHGYFDGEEREFGGFGMVEQWDTEEFAVLPHASNTDLASHIPPVLTRTWFHTGVYLGREHVSAFFAGLLNTHDRGEYYREPAWRDDDAEATDRLLPDTVLSAGLSLDEQREACRALRGTMLRQEVYALDGTAAAEHPHTVTEQNATIECVQPRERNRHAVFFSHAREALSHHYERNPNDPRTGHALTLEVDAFGNVRKALAIGYGRRAASTDPALTAADKAKQTHLLLTYTDNSFTKAIDSADDYRAPLPAEAQTYELTGFSPANNDLRFSFDEWTVNGFALLAAAAAIPYEQQADNTSKQKRLIEDVRTLYRTDDLTALLPRGEIEPLALPGVSYKLALTPGLLARVYTRKRPGQPDEDLLPNPGGILEAKGPAGGGYVQLDGAWWIPSSRIFCDPGADVANPGLTAAQELTTARQHFYLPRMITDPFDRTTVVDYDAHDLLVARTADALGNTITAANDYRVLQPTLVTDPNRNRTAAVFDILSMVVATAVMGKATENLGDLPTGFAADPSLADLQAFVADPQAQAGALLGNATTRIVYDLDRYARAGQPPFASTLARETHAGDPGGDHSTIQISFSYSDGFGREIQKKLQAEPGMAPQRQADVLLPGGDIRPGDFVRDPQDRLVQANTPRRWVGTGRTVFNNKGKPVKQYEPFFSATHLYEPESEMTDAGVTPVLFYDPIERVVATLNPNHTYAKVVFDAWQQTTYDANDTVAASGAQTGDPRTDPDIASYVHEYFKTQPATWQTWHAQRIANQLGEAERDAARKAAAHAGTPAVAHLDALGRTFLTITDNGPDPALPAAHLLFAARVELDIEANQRTLLDAKDRVVMRYDYDMLGSTVHQASMEAGERWTLNDATGEPIRAWDSRGFNRRMTYDALRRPTGLYVIEHGAERLAEQTIYGEAQGAAGNHLTRVYQVCDGAGILTSVAFDFKGNLLESRRDLLPNYTQGVDWQQNPVANDGSFSGRTTYDALNRPLAVVSPDASVYRPTFNEANRLDTVDVSLRGTAAATPFVANINYNAKGQRELIEYGCGAGPGQHGVTTTYEYDRDTFRLIRLRTTRPAGLNGVASQIFADPTVVQDLRYTYDPMGNITRIADAALTPIFHNNEQVDPVCSYTYDALYRLTEARGREHIGQTAHAAIAPGTNRRDHPFAGLAELIAHPNDLQAMRNYSESYKYDAAGNIEQMRHMASNGDWTQRYDYLEPSLLEAAKQSNRLSKTTLGNGPNQIETYSYADAQGNDVHGCMTAVNSMAMVWDFEDQLQQASPGPSTGYYIYDAGGRRVRKVIQSQAGTRQKERIYIGGYEVYREYAGNGTTKTLERESLHILDDKQRIALVETQTIANGNPVNAPVPVQRYQLGNHLGSASVELDQDGALISYEEYHSYGTIAFQAGRSAAEVSLKRYRYTGKERDEESGLCYHETRYLAPWLGRWTSCDPIDVKGGLNLYAHAADNPLNMIDGSGKAPCEWFDMSCQVAQAKAAQAKKDEQKFNDTHVYSTAPEAAQKRKIDEQIMGGDFAKGNAIDMHSEAYLKELIKVASKENATVSNNAKGLQFFIIKGGGEGFLDKTYKGIDASNVEVPTTTTSGAPGSVFRFDNNDLLVAFDSKGKLLSSALLERPLSITNPTIWTEKTANKVYDNWDRRSVSIYRNENFDIKYYGLRVDDKLGYYKSGRVRIDLHKQEATNGCIFITDPNTPPYSDATKLNRFEPQFILDVQKSIGKKTQSNIGTMRMIDVR